MKLLSKLFFLTLVSMLYACLPNNEMLSYDYYLKLSFQDVSGNDLVKGIDSDEMWGQHGIVTSEEDAIVGIVKPDLYKLDIIFQKPELYFGKNILNGVIKDNELGFEKREGYSYLGLRISSRRNKPPETKITFRLTCPYVFGDDVEHDIVTYWKRNDNRYSQLCHRIEFEGKEFSQITYESHKQVSIAALVIEN